MLCLEADSKLQCGLCVSKPMTVRTAYTHFFHKHEGTLKGPFIRDQCELIRCEDKNKIYQLRPDDGIICNLCERGSNCGKFMTLIGYWSHITKSCPKVVPHIKREAIQEKWRNANGRKKEEKVDEESGSNDEDENEESENQIEEREEDGANEGDQVRIAFRKLKKFRQTSDKTIENLKEIIHPLQLESPTKKKRNIERISYKHFY